MAELKIFGRVRQLLQGIDQASVGDDEQFALSEQLEQLIAISSSQYGEIVKIGRAFEIHTQAPVAAVVAMPTVANLLAIWNGEPDGGRAYIIDRVWSLLGVGTAAAGQATVVGCLGQTRVAPLTAGTLGITALNGNGGHDTKAVHSIGTNLDAVTGVPGNWRVLPGQKGGQKFAATATPGVFNDCEINGRIIVPPGRLFAVHVMADVVGSLFTVGIEWHEKVIRLG